MLEADGHRFHGSRLAFERDRRRDRDLTLSGYTVVRATRDQIHGESDAVMAAIGGLLANRAKDM